MVKSKIRMRTNNSENSICEVCGDKQSQVLEMFDLQIGGTIHILCDSCVEQISNKALKANYKVNCKIKTKHDLAIIKRRNNRKYSSINTTNIPINEALKGE